MNTSCVFWLSGLVMLVGTACRPTTDLDDVPTCTYPHQVVVDAGCYNGNGLQVTATEYGDSPSGFEWIVIALKDTTSGSWSWTATDQKINILGSDKLTIPDSIAANYPRLIIKVATNCQGILKHSIYYGYTKERSANGTCTVWTQRTN